MNGFISSSDESYTLDENLNKGTYRLLDEYKQSINPNNVVFKEDIPNYSEHEKKDIYNNKRRGIRRSEKLNKSLNNERFYTHVTDYNKEMFDRKYFRFEKKWVNKKYYGVSKEQNGRIRDIDIKKIKFRSYKFLVAVIFLFFLFGIGYPILQGLEKLKTLRAYLLSILGYFMNDPSPAQHLVLSIFFGALIIILAIIIIITIPKILINNEKCNKFKFMNVQKE
ncbi:Plasmodium exported protein (Pm-fam-a like), unknown function [Plasmodium malariae]|uniref:Uncharacterized protein n=2 Tax=Plasmodium (Plasmodium) TaxID=418103 RepID=A0A1A8WW13_PLAMA|nr:Plasmodium exported protein (Pm-fam-a like), unknown function [Plasmodium malariae]